MCSRAREARLAYYLKKITFRIVLNLANLNASLFGFVIYNDMRIFSSNHWVKLCFFCCYGKFHRWTRDIFRLNVSEHAKVGHYIFAVHAVEKIL